MNKWEKKASKGLIETKQLKEHKVRVYKDRLAIWRNDGERLTWDELQQIKEEVWGDVIAVEIYPLSNCLVNLRNTRHLWKTDKLEAVVIHECTHEEFL